MEDEKKPVFEPWNALRGVGSSIHTNRRLVELKAPKCVLEGAAKTLENGLQRLKENEVEVATEIKRRLGILAKKSAFEMVAREIGRIDIPDAELPPRDERLIKEAIELYDGEIMAMTCLWCQQGMSQETKTLEAMEILVLWAQFQRFDPADVEKYAPRYPTLHDLVDKDWDKLGYGDDGAENLRFNAKAWKRGLEHTTDPSEALALFQDLDRWYLLDWALNNGLHHLVGDGWWERARREKEEVKVEITNKDGEPETIGMVGRDADVLPHMEDFECCRLLSDRSEEPIFEKVRNYARKMLFAWRRDWDTEDATPLAFLKHHDYNFRNVGYHEEESEAYTQWILDVRKRIIDHSDLQNEMLRAVFGKD